MAKQTIQQRSFLLGEPREEFLEADDLEVRNASLRRALNLRVKATRTLAARLGTVFALNLGNFPTWEVRPTSDEAFIVTIEPGRLTIRDADLLTVFTTTTVTFGDVEAVWLENFAKEIVIGSVNGLFMLTFVSRTSWTLAPFAFDLAPGNELAQPYHSFVGNLTMQPSARTGAITLTSSGPFFSPAYVGLRIRYNRREILITGYTSPTQVSGLVQSQLAPTWRLEVGSATGFQVGDALVGQDTDFQGVIVAVSPPNIDVATLQFFEGPDVDELVSTISGSSKVVSKTEITPAASPIWDEPLISPVRGYPRAGGGAAGRLIFCDFPQIPDMVVASSARTIKDFKVGDEDDDAIARQIGDNAPRFLHVVNAGDLILLADRGCYLVSLRDGAPLSPSTFNATIFDTRGSSTVKPALVDDGVIFVEASGEAIAAAQLAGNIYVKWSVRTISTFHDHLVKAPVALCGPAANSEMIDKYLFIVNGDGSLASMSWVEGFDAENIGFTPWETEGAFKRVFTAFGHYWPIVERELPGGPETLLERFDIDAIVDCQLSALSAIPSIFEGQDLHLTGRGWYDGVVTVTAGSAGSDLPADAVVGFNFTAVAGLWPADQVQHPKAGIVPARVVRVGVSVLHTGVFSIRCNNTTQSFGGYDFGDDLSLPAKDRTRLYRCSVVGRRDHPEIEIIKSQPGEFQILATAQEVII